MEKGKKIIWVLFGDTRLKSNREFAIVDDIKKTYNNYVDFAMSKGFEIRMLKRNCNKETLLNLLRENSTYGIIWHSHGQQNTYGELKGNFYAEATVDKKIWGKWPLDEDKVVEKFGYASRKIDFFGESVSNACGMAGISESLFRSMRKSQLVAPEMIKDVGPNLKLVALFGCGTMMKERQWLKAFKIAEENFQSDGDLTFMWYPPKSLEEKKEKYGNAFIMPRAQEFAVKKFKKVLRELAEE